MRVLHVIPGLELRDGGPSRAIRAMTTVLQQRGIEIVIATTHHRAEGPAHDAGLTVPVLSFPRQTAPGWKLSLPLAQWLDHHAGRFDLLHLHSTFCFTTLAGAWLARRRQRPYIIRPLGTLDAWSRQQQAWKKSPYYALFERRNLAHAAALHATSESEAGHLRRLGLPTPIAIIPLGFDLPAAPPPRTISSPLQLLFLSRLHPKKNLPVLFEAVRILQQGGMTLTLTIAGDGEDGYCEELQRLIAALGLQETILFTGWVDGDQKRDLLARSHLFVLPSLQENFGIAVLEALGAGLPAVLSTEVALSAEVVQAGAGMVVPPQEPAELADAIRRLTDPAVHAVASRAAVRLAQEKFSLTAMTDGLLHLYRSITHHTITHHTITDHSIPDHSIPGELQS